MIRFLPPTSGQVLIDGHDIYNNVNWNSKRSSIVGLCPQFDALIGNFSYLIDLALLLIKFDRTFDWERAA